MSAVKRTVNVQEAKTHLSRLLREVEAGEEIAIARAGRVIAHLVRAEPAESRNWAVFDGAGRIDEDAFSPMTAAEEAVWYGPVEPE